MTNATYGPNTPPPALGGPQGSAGLTDVATQLLGIVLHLSNNGKSLQSLITAVQGESFNGYKVAGLPAAPAIGSVAYVTDGANALAWGNTVTGGGANNYLVWWNGSNWTVIGK